MQIKSSSHGRNEAMHLRCRRSLTRAGLSKTQRSDAACVKFSKVGSGRFLSESVATASGGTTNKLLSRLFRFAHSDPSASLGGPATKLRPAVLGCDELRSGLTVPSRPPDGTAGWPPLKSDAFLVLGSIAYCEQGRQVSLFCPLRFRSASAWYS